MLALALRFAIFAAGSAFCIIGGAFSNAGGAFFIAGGALFTAGGAWACDAPKASPGGRVFHIDPARGSAEGDGSAAHPWRSLAEALEPARGLVGAPRPRRRSDGVFAADPAGGGPIRAGDAIELADGDYGDIKLTGYANEDYISIAAAPGAKPVLHSLWIAGASHWLLRGLTFSAARGESGPPNAIVEVVSHAALGPSDHIAFIGNRFFTSETVADWSPEDWVKRPKSYGFLTQARCTLARGNAFYNLRNALGVGGDESLVEDNVIHDFGNDGVDFYASGVTIRHNRISASRHTPAEPLHPDAIQGWGPNGQSHRDILIDGNVIANLNPAEDNEMQGISIFTDRWDGVTVQNNAIATNAWHGIALYGVRNAKVVNNTLAATRPGQKDSWIFIRDSADHAVRGEALARNNIATALVIENADVVVDHNVTAKPIRVQKEARVADDGSNRVAPLAPLFRAFAPASGAVDLHLASSAPLTGEKEGAPDRDADGQVRAAPVDPGAYARR
jgi:hypothetical protein